MELVTIPKKEYLSLKKKSIVDKSIVDGIKRGLEDIKAGRISEWKQFR